MTEEFRAGLIAPSGGWQLPGLVERHRQERPKC